MTRLILLFAVLLLSLPLTAEAQTFTVTKVTTNCATDSTEIRAEETLPTRRIKIELVNDSDTVLYLAKDGNAAVANTGIRLNANGGSYVDDVSASQKALYCIHGGSGNKVLSGFITTLTP